MKKQLLNLSLVAMFFAISGVIIAAPLRAPVKNMDINYAATVTADGDVDAGYGAVQTTDAFNTTGSTGADADFTMTFQACANYEKLWIFFTVLDEYACEAPYTTTADPYTYDNLELFLNLDTIDLVTGYDSTTIQLRFNRGHEDSIQSPGRAAQEEYELYFENTSDGYIIEVGIPWTAVLQDSINGEATLPDDIEAYIDPVVNGFDVSGADNDTDEGGSANRTCQTAWDSDDPTDTADEDLAWNNRTMFGTMKLMNFPTIGVNDQIENSLGMYPNPAATTINIVGNEGTVEIFNMTGAKVLEATGSVIDISGLSAGIYNVVAGNESGRVIIK